MVFGARTTTLCKGSEIGSDGQFGRVRALLKRLPQDRIVQGVEVGVFKGQMSEQLLRAAPNLYLYMVDSWLPAEQQPWSYHSTNDFHSHRSQREQESFKQQAVSRTEFARDRRQVIPFDSLQAASKFAPHSLDFVFLDGDHSYQGVRRDIAVWKGAIKHDGWIGGHDYETDSGCAFGVIHGVVEAALKYRWVVEEDSDATWFVNLGRERVL